RRPPALQSHHLPDERAPHATRAQGQRLDDQVVVVPMELPFLHWLRTQLPAAPNIPLGIGDDAALLTQQTGKQTVVTTDMLMDGVDFILKDCGPFAAGRKALAVNLSDLAAMGAKPVAAFVSLCLPRTNDSAH